VPLAQLLRDTSLFDKVNEAKPSAKTPGAPKGNQNAKKGKNNCDNIIIESHGSTSQTYLVRRLKRDAPEIAEALGRGEYPSARSAAKAAGIIKALTPLDMLKRAWAKASDIDTPATMSY
jgi:hypothetical protein